MKITQINELNYKGQNIYIGLDVHLKSWSITILSETLTLKKFSQNPNPQTLSNFLRTNYPNANYYSAYEAGFCGFWIHYELTDFGIVNIVVNPGDVPTMVKEKVRKTDAVDSGKLARSLRSGELKGIYVPSRTALERRSLIRLRGSTVKDLTRDKNRIKSLLRFYGIELPLQFERPNTHWSKRFMLWLESIAPETEHGKEALSLLIQKAKNNRELLLRVTKRIRDISRQEPYTELMRLVTTVPGIGATIGMILLSEIEDISRFKNSDQLAAYIGLIPMCHSSGEHQYDGDITTRKHRFLRHQIVEAAWRAIRRDPAMTLAYEQYRLRMNANRAIIKIARKLVNRLYFVMKRKQVYVPAVVR
jgi:transposase